MGDDVNTPLLDQLSNKTRGTSSYVRPQENIEVKVSGFFDKISHPILANLQLVVEDSSVKLTEMYPPKLPDLFHGGQLVMTARYTGNGSPKFKFTGMLGSEQKTFEFSPSLPTEKSEDDFVALLWAQRKIGYLLEQIRDHGENKELVDEVTAVAKKFGIVTPYTSYLLVPDEKSAVSVVPIPRSSDSNVHPSKIGADASVARGFGMGGGGVGGQMSINSVGGNSHVLRIDPSSREVLQPEKVERFLRQQNVLAGRNGRMTAGEQLGLQSGSAAVENAQVFSELKMPINCNGPSFSRKTLRDGISTTSEACGSRISSMLRPNSSA